MKRSQDKRGEEVWVLVSENLVGKTEKGSGTSCLSEGVGSGFQRDSSRILTAVLIDGIWHAGMHA